MDYSVYCSIALLLYILISSVRVQRVGIFFHVIKTVVLR